MRLFNERIYGWETLEKMLSAQGGKMKRIPQRFGRKLSNSRLTGKESMVYEGGEGVTDGVVKIKRENLNTRFIICANTNDIRKRVYEGPLVIGKNWLL